MEEYSFLLTNIEKREKYVTGNYEYIESISRGVIYVVNICIRYIYMNA